jgi:hypothetical protein
MDLYGVRRALVFDWLASLPGRLMIVAALTSRARLPVVPKPAMLS